MKYLDNKMIVIDGKRVAALAVIGDTIKVSRLPACSVGTYFHVLYWLRCLGYQTI